MKNYLIQRGGRYYFNRRVPEDLRDYDSRLFIRVALKTDSYDQALQKAIILNRETENYWQKLVAAGETHVDRKYQMVVQLARTLGFSYMPAAELGGGSLRNLVERLQHVEKNYTQTQAEAVLGGIAVPEMTAEAALDRYFELTKDRIFNKDANQIRKWKAPRMRAIANFSKCLGRKKPLKDLQRDDVMKFKDWWIERMRLENLGENSLNKDMIHLKNIIELVNENDNLGLDTDRIFRKLTIKERFGSDRPPFTIPQINTLLNRKKLQGLNTQAMWFLHAMAETGARLTELTGLRPEDIKLSGPIPYISIVDRKEKALKTVHSARDVPLVGYALDAFQACPNGFTDYAGHPDSLSAALNKYLRENDLMPSEKHTVYSLRHGFQDRLLSVNAPDRIQAELMGHKFERPKYGEGGTLAHKLEWLQKIQIKK